MKITIESTDQIVHIAARDGGDEIECRVWEGVTSKGTPVQCLIPRIAAPGVPCLDKEFASDLHETRPPTLHAFPLRMIL